MGIVRDSFVIFKEWDNAIRKAPDAVQLELYHALMDFASTGEIPKDLTWEAEMLLTSFERGMHNSILRYNASVENGKKGGRPKKQVELEDDERPCGVIGFGGEECNTENLEKPNETQENLEKPNQTNHNQSEPTHNLNVHVNVHDNVNVDDDEKEINKEKEFHPSSSIINTEFNFKILEDEKLNCDISSEKFKSAVNSSQWLSSLSLLDASWLNKNYNKIVEGYYQNYSITLARKNGDANFRQRDYSGQNLNALFCNLDDLDLGEVKPDGD